MSGALEDPTGEYALRGDYHRRLDPHWSYAPIYRRKIAWLDGVMAEVTKGAQILDVGAGEGAIVERYRERGHDIVGVDLAYHAAHVRRADLRSLPFESGAFDVVLCLDVLEHVQVLDQSQALSEMARVTKAGGRLLVTVPNLAHLHSRIQFLFRGKLTRTSAVERHPGDRPLVEYLALIEGAGFHVERRGGIFPTVPFLFRAVNHHPQKLGWLVACLDAILPFPGLRFLATIETRRTETRA